MKAPDYSRFPTNPSNEDTHSHMGRVYTYAEEREMWFSEGIPVDLDPINAVDYIIDYVKDPREGIGRIRVVSFKQDIRNDLKTIEE
jgi:hypothetical protein